MNMNIAKGVGPYPRPWPKDNRFDEKLLTNGDTRNVIDKYRYWTEQAIIADLDQNGVSLEIAIENIERDFNMGTIVRSANAFGVRHVHVVGRKQWNKRGAMKTDTYLHIHYYQNTDEFVTEMRRAGKQLVAVDIVTSAEPLPSVRMTKDTVLVFGQEGPGLSTAMIEASDAVGYIPQHGSTRSLNVGVAAGIAMYIWASTTG